MFRGDTPGSGRWRRASARAVLAVVSVLCVAAVAVGTATAADPVFVTSFDGSGTPDGFFDNTRVTVDESSGDIYVVDAAHDVVDRFGSDGTYRSQIRGSDTSLGSFGFGGNAQDDLAVDSSGNLYVSGGSGNDFKFDSSGTEQWAQAGAAGRPCGIGLDPSGRLWIADRNNTVLAELDPADGTPTGTTINFGGSDVCKFAFSSDFVSGSAGAAYMAGRLDVLNKYDSSGGFVQAMDTTVSPQTFDVATDASTGNVFAVTTHSDGPKLLEWSSDGSELFRIDANVITSELTGVAVDSAQRRLYISDRTVAQAGGTVSIYDLGSAVSAGPPIITPDPSTDITKTSATLHATINANGSDVTECHAEVSANASFTGARTFPCNPASPLTGNTDVEVTAAATGLTPATNYHTRFVATNAIDTTLGSDVLTRTLSPTPPTVRTGDATDVGETSATLNGSVNPRGVGTSCVFEYGPTTSYGSQVATADPGAGSADVAVRASVSGLTAGTAYHFRLSCRSADGSVSGSDASFTTVVPTTTTTPPPPPPPPSCPTDPSKCAAKLALSGSPLARISGSTAQVGIKCTGDTGGSCRSSLTFTAKVKYKVKRGRRTVTKTRTITVGRATVDLGVGSSSTLRLALTAAARRALKRGPLSATATGLAGSVRIPKIKSRKPAHRR